MLLIEVFIIPPLFSVRDLDTNGLDTHRREQPGLKVLEVKNKVNALTLELL